MSGGQFRDSGEGRQRVRHVPQAEERRNPALVQPARKAVQRKQRAQLRAERDPVGRHPVAQGLDTNAIAGQHQPLGAGVPQSDGEHPPQSPDEVVPYFFVEVDDRLGIAPRTEAMAAGDQVATQLVMIVDLAVENDLDRAVLIPDRLLPAGDIDDREPAHAERDLRSDEVPAIVGSAMDDRVAHGAHGATGRFGPELPPRKARNAAHRATPPSSPLARATRTRRSAVR